MNKKFYRCKVCGDIHYGVAGPSPCPTCKASDSYLEITKEEAVKAIGV